MLHMPNMSTGPIAYIVQKFPNLTITFIYREIQALRSRGIEIATFSIWKPRRDELSQEAAALMDDTFYVFPLDKPRFLRAHLYYFFTRPLRYINTLFFLSRKRAGGIRKYLRHLYHFAEGVYLAKAMEERRVRHIHAGFASNPATLALVISRLTGISFSFAAHAYGIFAEPTLLKEKLEAAKFVVAISKYNKDYLSAQFPDVTAGKIKVIYLGVSTRNFRAEGWGQNIRPRLLSVAQLREKKGLPFLIEACRILKSEGHEFECCIVGDGTQRAYLEALIEKYNLQDVVRLEGVVFQEELKKYYQQADIFVLPCIVARDGDRDGIPVVLMEAMAMSRPVVSTFVSGIPELVEHGRTGLLVPPYDAPALARALLTLLQDEELRRRMGYAGREKVLRQFDIQNSVDQVSALFAEQIG